MANILILDGHPDPGPAFCHALAEAYVEGARSAGHETRLTRLADAQFPVLRSAAAFNTAPTEPDLLRAREDIAWAGHLVLVFPLWLGAAPALLKAFLEQTARGGFMMVMGPRGAIGRLKGKSARLIVTMGMPALIYRLAFGAHGVASLSKSVFGFAGASPIRSTLIGMVEAKAAVQKRRIDRIRALGAKAA
jgi:putative NADPH-quinone reductase